jgi:hypothetical protein
VAAIRENVPFSAMHLLVQADPSITRIRDDDGKHLLRRVLNCRIDHPDMVRLLCTSPEAVQEKDAFGLNCLTLVLEPWLSTPASINPEAIDIL